jgi:hypothetical protein
MSGHKKFLLFSIAKKACHYWECALCKVTHLLVGFIIGILLCVWGRESMDMSTFWQSKGGEREREGDSNAHICWTEILGLMRQMSICKRAHSPFLKDVHAQQRKEGRKKLGGELTLLKNAQWVGMKKTKWEWWGGLGKGGDLSFLMHD